MCQLEDLPQWRSWLWWLCIRLDTEERVGLLLLAWTEIVGALAWSLLGQ